VLDALQNFALKLMDALLGWTLALPSDATLFIVAIGSALVLTGVRVWTSDQDLLRRCKHDKQRLKALMREAKRRKDKPAIQRHRAVNGMIGLTQMRQEWRPLLAALVPLALLATWAFGRLEFHPPRAGEPIEFTATFPLSAVGKIAHVAPMDGITATNGWIQQIEHGASGGTPRGVATWKLRAEARPEPYVIQLRSGAQTCEHPLRVGQRIYEAPLKTHDDQVLATEVSMKQLRLFGIVPGIPAIALAPWLVAYLLIVIPFVFILKRLLRIY
jgi:uncharacterized membrane protein (DUF106 family)